MWWQWSWRKEFIQIFEQSQGYQKHVVLFAYTNRNICQWKSKLNDCLVIKFCIIWIYTSKKHQAVTKLYRSALILMCRYSQKQYDIVYHVEIMQGIAKSAFEIIDKSKVKTAIDNARWNLCLTLFMILISMWYLVCHSLSCIINEISTHKKLKTFLALLQYIQWYMKDWIKCFMSCGSHKCISAESCYPVVNINIIHAINKTTK